MEKLTQLTRPDLTKKANGWISKYPERWAEIQATTNYPYQYLGKILEAMYGTPVWRESKNNKSITGTLPTSTDPGVLFRLEDAGNGRVKYKSVPTRRATRGGPTGTSSGTRRFTERITSPPGTDFADSERRMGKANSRGMDGGHRTPLDRQRAGQVEAVNRGRTVQQYQQQFLSNGIPIGHTRENIEDQTPKDNRVRQRQDYGVVDNALYEMEINPQRLDYLLNKTKAKPKPKPKSKPKSKPKPKSNTRPRSPLRIGGALGNYGSGSDIVDRVNGRMHLISPLTADIIELL